MLNRPKFIATLLLAFPTLLFSMEDSENSTLDKLEESSAKHYFHGSSLRELEDVFEDAPQKAKDTVAHLKDPSFLGTEGYRAAFLIGESGVGKTTLAKAIAYKAEWKCEPISFIDVLGAHPEETACKLKKALDAAVCKAKKETVIIIDDMDLLFDKDHQDTDLPSEALHAFLDQQNSNYKSFFIGTMSRTKIISQQTKKFILPFCIRLAAPTNPAMIRKIFLSKLVDNTTSLHEECDERFLDACFKIHSETSGRDLQGFASSVCEIFRREDKTSPVKVIRKKHFKQALEEREEMKKILKYDEIAGVTAHWSSNVLALKELD